MAAKHTAIEIRISRPGLPDRTVSMSLEDAPVAELVDDHARGEHRTWFEAEATIQPRRLEAGETEFVAFLGDGRRRLAGLPHQEARRHAQRREAVGPITDSDFPAAQPDSDS